MGPTFLDLQIITNTDVKEASAFFTAFFVGSQIGAVLGGLVGHKVSFYLFDIKVLLCGKLRNKEYGYWVVRSGDNFVKE